jgi:hypothetical protein
MKFCSCIYNANKLNNLEINYKHQHLMNSACRSADFQILTPHLRKI